VVSIRLFFGSLVGCFLRVPYAFDQRKNFLIAVCTQNVLPPSGLMRLFRIFDILRLIQVIGFPLTPFSQSKIPTLVPSPSDGKFFDIPLVATLCRQPIIVSVHWVRTLSSRFIDDFLSFFSFSLYSFLYLVSCTYPLCGLVTASSRRAFFFG